MDNPIVSVIIPIYNGERFVSEVIESALAQTYKNIEIIVVNDGSTDKSEEKILRYKDRIKYVYQKNKGIAGAYNTGIADSRGELIAFLEQDDLWLSEKTARQVDYFNIHPEIALVHTGVYIEEVDPFDTKRKVFEPKFILEGDCFKKLVIKNCIISFSSIMLKKEVLEETGPFNNGLKIAVDYDMWLRVAYEHKLGYIKDPLAIKRIHGLNLSLDDSGMTKEDLDIKASWYKKKEVGKENRKIIASNIIELNKELAWVSAQKGYFSDERKHLWNIVRLKPFEVSSWINFSWHLVDPQRRDTLAWYKKRLKFWRAK